MSLLVMGALSFVAGWSTIGYFRAVRRYRRLRCLMAVGFFEGDVTALGVSGHAGVPLHATYSLLRGLEDDGLVASTEVLGDPFRGGRPTYTYGITESGRAALRGEGGS